MIGGKQMTRADDEHALAIIKARCAGLSSSVVAKRFGVSSAYVRVTTNKIRKADEVEEGAELSAFYW